MKIGYVRVSKQEQHEVLQWENRTGNTCLIPTSGVEYKVDKLCYQ
jgi:DNA invertase Pin-like site-specific DNA recombinase